jgi:GMP synthase (glutamine-hydrolysing)
MFEARLQESAEAGAAGLLPQRAQTALPRKPVCIVLHQENSNPGHVGHWFRRNGYALDIRKPRFGDALPETLADHCGAVIFGGPMSANDKDEFVVRETEWIGVALKEEKPFLGICLGAQMLTNHLGGRVAFHPRELVEVGYYPLETTEEGMRVGQFPEQVYQWHREGCELPRCARLLATSREGAYPIQAFGHGPAVGVQFHPEITCAQVYRWSGHNPARLGMNGARERREHIDGHLHHGPKVQAWLDRFLARWVACQVTID